MKCPIILDNKNAAKDDNDNRLPRSKLPSVQRLYNRFKPAGSRALFIKTPSQNSSNRQIVNPHKTPPKTDKGKGREQPPRPTIDDSIHNSNNHSNNDTNKKLDQILNMLSNMQKAMSDLELRIAKLEKIDLNSDSTSITSSSNIPPKPFSHDLVLNFNQKKRTRVANSSSDKTVSNVPKAVDPKIQTYMDEQNAIISELHQQLKLAMSQITDLASKANQ